MLLLWLREVECYGTHFSWVANPGGDLQGGEGVAGVAAHDAKGTAGHSILEDISEHNTFKFDVSCGS